jgi:ferredoxin-NADP reductase
MLRHAVARQTPQDVVLLYSNRRPEDAAYLDELRQLEQQNPRFRLMASMTDMARSTRRRDGATKKIDGAWIRQAIANLDEPIAYVSGPPAMVQAMRLAITAAGVDDDDVRSEEFHGY